MLLDSTHRKSLTKGYSYKYFVAGLTFEQDLGLFK